MVSLQQTAIFDRTSAMNDNTMMDGNGNAMVHNTSRLHGVPAVHTCTNGVYQMAWE